MTDQFDVIVVGAGVGGATASVLLARQGLKVLVIDRKRGAEDYKRVCTTFIQRSALPTIRKLGLKDRLDAAGAVQNNAVFWTEYGWIKDDGPRDPATAHGYSVRRQVLDPLLLDLIAAEPNITLHLGASLTGLIEDGGLYRGIEWDDASGATHAARASLVVLADGRNSPGAKLAGVPTRNRDNQRFVYYSYYTDMPLKTGKVAQFWQVGRDMGFAYPFDDGLTMLCSFVTQDQHEAWAPDRRAALEAFFKGLPEAPDQSAAQPASEMLGMRKLNDYWRPAVWKGLALVGDACMSCDPMSGVGCGFAFQAADWLAEEVGPILGAQSATVAALERYRRKHRKFLAGHEYFIQDASNGRPPNLLERMISRAAVADAEVAHRLHLFIGRVTRWNEFLSPGTLARILRANIAYAMKKGEAFHALP